MPKLLHKIVKKEAPREFQKDWDRQFSTAEAIISRFEGKSLDTVLLADEVGMGKTYAALAVAAHHIFQSKENDRKVLLVVPQNNILKRKWEQEIRSFNKRYIQDSLWKKGKQKKMLRPLVVNDYWTLIRNLHDFKNEDLSRVYEEKKQCFALTLWHWGQKFRKKKAWKTRWDITGELNDWSTEYLDFCSRFSQMAIFEFLNEKDAIESGAVKQLVSRLNNQENCDYHVKELFREFCQKQDAYEPNVFVIGMRALGKGKGVNLKLLKTYIINLCLTRRRAPTRRRVIEALRGVIWPGTETKRKTRKWWHELLRWNAQLGRINLWGLCSSIQSILDEEQIGTELKKEIFGECNKERVSRLLNNMHTRAIQKKLQKSGIGLTIVDEVHNWKNKSNGAPAFHDNFARNIHRKLIMSATPFQINEGELGRVYGYTCGEHTDHPEHARQSATMEVIRKVLAAGGAASKCLDASARFQEKWSAISAADNKKLKTSFDGCQNRTETEYILKEFARSEESEPENIALFASVALEYRKSIENLRKQLFAVMIRHTKNRDIRRFHVGREYAKSGLPDYSIKRTTLYSVEGQGDVESAFLNYMGMRADMLIRRDQGKGFNANAHLMGGMTSSTAAFIESNARLLKKEKISKATADYLKFFQKSLNKCKHPKVKATVERAFENYKRGLKTLIFCERLKTLGEIKNELQKKLDSIHTNQMDVKKMVQAQMKKATQVDFSWTRSLIVAQGNDKNAKDLEMLYPKVVRQVHEWTEILKVDSLSERKQLKLIDLSFFKILTEKYKKPKKLRNAIDLVNSIGEDADALWHYLDIKKRQNASTNEDFEDESELNTEIDELAKRYLQLDNIWFPKENETTFHCSIWYLLADEARQFENEKHEVKVLGFSEIMLDLAQRFRKVLLRSDMLPRLTSAQYGLVEALKTVPIAIVQEKQLPVETPWSRTLAYLKMLIDAEGSINRRSSHSSKRQSLWRGASLKESWMVGILHGGIDSEARVTRCAAFNSPLVPDVLVCTGIGSEGIDLHTQCADVIHHDLPWNPAKLEQRTGRIDRVGCFAETLEGIKLNIGIPFLAHNYEKFQYDLVFSRAQKFEILLGKPEFSLEVDDDFEVDSEGNETDRITRSKEKINQKSIVVPLPEPILKFLQMDLAVYNKT